MGVEIIPISAFKDNYIWAIIEPLTHKAAVIDPGDAQPVLTYFNKYGIQLTTILITHHHWDHTNGIKRLTEHFEKVSVYGPANEKIRGITHKVAEGDVIVLPGFKMKLKVLALPGHTTGHVAYYNDHYLFSGDTLFTAGCGKIFEGNANQLYNSLLRLKAMPDKTLVYCGHEYTEHNLRFAQAIEPNNEDITERMRQVKNLRLYGKPSVPSLMAVEKRTNPFLRCDEAAIIDSVEGYWGKPLSTPVEIFSVLREWKNHF